MVQMVVDRHMRDHRIGEREGRYAILNRAYAAYTKHLLAGACPCEAGLRG